MATTKRPNAETPITRWRASATKRLNDQGPVDWGIELAERALSSLSVARHLRTMASRDERDERNLVERVALDALHDAECLAGEIARHPALGVLEPGMRLGEWLRSGCVGDPSALFTELVIQLQRFTDLTKALPSKDDQRKPAPLDVVNDPDCKTLRDILRGGPKALRAIAADKRCVIARRRVSELLAAMRKRGMVEQTKARGPWRFVSDTPTK